MVDVMGHRTPYIPPTGEMIEAGRAAGLRDGLRIFADTLCEIFRAMDEAAWQPISTAPGGDCLFLAATDDGRIMIVKGSILASMLANGTPDHLQFPATRWRRLPHIPQPA